MLWINPEFEPAPYPSKIRSEEFQNANEGGAKCPALKKIQREIRIKNGKIAGKDEIIETTYNVLFQKRVWRRRTKNADNANKIKNATARTSEKIRARMRF